MLRRLSPFLAACILTSQVAIAADIPGKDEPCEISVLWGNPAISKLELSTWLSYLMFRALALRGVRECGDLMQVVEPSFDDELAARERAVASYAALKPKLQEAPVPYFEDLSKAFNAGFQREYVWTYLSRPAWRTAPGGLRLKEFDEWRGANLSGHAGATVGGVGVAKAGPNNKGAIVIRPYDFSAAR
jgi:hypothetical protein